MKRTPLNRYTELKRKKPIRKMSDKKKQELDETGPWRRAYREEIGVCSECRRNGKPKEPSTEVHEIVGGPSRCIATYLPDTWRALCHRCHQQEQSTLRARQIAKKWLDVLDVTNSCCDGRGYTDAREVVEELRKLIGGLVRLTD